MRFINSLVMLLTATCAVISAYFVGHWLVIRHEGHTWPLLVAAVLLGVAGLFGFVHAQLSKRHPMTIDAAHGHGHGHHHVDA